MKRSLSRLLALCCCVAALAYRTLFVAVPPPSWAPIMLAAGADGARLTLMAQSSGTLVAVLCIFG